MTPDDRQRLSAIAHAGSLMWGPISAASVDGFVARLGDTGLGSTSRVLDLGCGPAELLRRVCERYGAHGIGIDSSPYALEEARRRLVGSPAQPRMELRQLDVADLPRREVHDLVVCLGPGWNAGGWTELTRWAAGFVAPGGHLLLGEAAWRAVPSAAALEQLEMNRDDYVDADAVADAVRAGGAEPVWMRRSTPGEWDEYGAAYRAALLDFVGRHPDDALAPAAAERAGPGWPVFETLHAVLDFVVVLARPVRS